MKLALIRRKFSATGGAELYVRRLMRELAAGGHEVHLFAEEWEEAEGVTVHQVRALGSRARKAVVFAEQVQRELGAERWDCVFSLERTLRQDVYRAGDGVHRVWLERRREFGAWWKRFFVGRGAFHRNMVWLEGKTFDSTRTGRVIVNSEMVRAEIVRSYGFPAERIHLVRNGVEVERFRGVDRAKARERYGSGAEEFVLLFVGSGWERKGLKVVTNEILPRLNAGRSRAVKLLVVGKGSRQGLREENVVWAGAEAEVEWAYAAADLFVFMPIYEPSANVCIEALAAGLPVVTTRQNGAGEVVREGETGTVLARPDDVEGALRAIRFWEERRRRVEVAGEELSLERNVRETVGILEMAAGEKRR